MDAGSWALVGVVVLLALAVGVLAGLVLGQRRRLEELSGTLREQAVAPPQKPEPASVPTLQEAEFLITRVGQSRDEPPSVGNQLVLSATLGEPLVKVAALAHGVRRALSAENRNRILFEVRREVRRTRKERRREMRAAWRESKQHRDAA